ncbi:MAG: hypothetical protein QXX08_09985 [Candidatus Bathyarchaeia archaeon]
MAAEDNKHQPHLDSVEKPKEKIEPPKPLFHKQTLICMGEYPTKILLKGPLMDKKDTPMPLFIDKFSEDIAKWSQFYLKPDSILSLNLNIDTRFWFQVLPSIANDDTLIASLKNRFAGDVSGTLIVSSLWDGVSSGLLPALVSQFKEWKIDTVAFVVLPSQMQLPDVHFNAFSSIGLCVSKAFASLLLFDRDHLESYVGVDRRGSILKGNVVFNYLLQLVLAKKTFVQEFSELSRNFNVRIYTVLLATGASLNLYGSIKNILDSALFRPFLNFDLSTASVVYVLFRIPVQFKEILQKGLLELEVANWFKEKANLRSLFTTEPIYVEDANDRVDVIMFVGGFETTKFFKSVERRIRMIKSFVVKNGSIKEDDWRIIVRSLGAD